MEEIRAFCAHLAAQAKRKPSAAGNTQQAVKDFVALYGSKNVSAARLASRVDVEKSSRSLARRNDVRVQPYLGVNTAPSLETGTNIFADSGLHVYAAASLAALSQGLADFHADMPTSEVHNRLQAYISKLADAPHWIFVAQASSPVRHDPTNPRALVRNLIATITAHLQGTGATEGIAAAANSVNLLASILSGSSDVSDTFYTAIGIFREGPESGAVFHAISITSLRMSHERFRKSSALDVEAQANTLVFQLNSPLLVAHAALYAQLPTTSVDDWFHSLNI